MIKLLRVDYRLVHGQVAISWSRHIGADCILVANDEVAKDEMRQSMLRLSKPQGMKLVIKSIEDSVKSIKSGVTDKYKMFIVVNNIQDVETAIRLSKAVIRNIKQNLFWAFFYNTLGIPIAAGVLHLFGGPLLSPVFAGAAMAFSSVSVVSNALRLRNFT